MTVKKLFYLLGFFACLLSLSSCSDEVKNERLKKENAELSEKIVELKKEKESLEISVSELEAREISELEKTGDVYYVVTIEIKQTHFTLDIGEHIKDAANKISMDFLVDKDYYEAVYVGQELDDSFRIGSFLINGSIGSWKVSVIDKRIAKKE